MGMTAALIMHVVIMVMMIVVVMLPSIKKKREVAFQPIARRSAGEAPGGHGALSLEGGASIKIARRVPRTSRS